MAKILLVDDDTDIVATMRLVLEKEKYKVETATDYEEGWTKLQSTLPDLIILDVMMPGKSGFDLAYAIRKNKKFAPIPILMITAINQKMPEFGFSPQNDGEYLPVDEFINKPVQPDELVASVKELIRKKVSKWINWPET